LNVNFVNIGEKGHGVGHTIDACDPEFAAHAPVSVTLITSHHIVASMRPNYLRAASHLLRANVDVAPWMAALLSGGSVAEVGSSRVRAENFCGYGAWRVCAGAVVAAVTLLVYLTRLPIL
jgi:hypothetical protein